MKKLLEFLESRAGVVGLWRKFADEPTPVRYAWLFTLGSAALLAFLVQLLTGILLAVSYAPTPDHAHESVKAIETKLAGGSLVRGLHHWGASAMVLLVALHLVRTFWFGAYKKPRELNWLLGVGLLVLVLLFGFTGYLLPWDQKAYWATVVGTKAPGSLPILGPASERLMTGGGSVGAYTLTRFFTIHVVLLPIVTLGLIAFHLLLLRKHTHAGAPSGPDPREPFVPYQLARDAVAGLVLVAALLFLAANHPAPLEKLADPSDTSYVPRPDWYFLPLFQLLKYFKGPLEPLGTAVLPGLAVAFLALIPWLDRAKERRPAARKGLLSIGTLAGGVVLVLLYLGAKDKPKNGPVSAFDPSAQPPPDPRVLNGALSYEKRGCVSCHGSEGKGGAPNGFALAGRTFKLKGDALVAHLKEKSSAPPAPTPAEEAAGAFDPDKDVPSLAAYTEALQEGPLSLAKLPPKIRVGGAVVDREDCRDCHQIYGDGGRRGPPLQHLAGKRDVPWLVAHFIDPKKLVPGSKMPTFKNLPQLELEAMSEYVLALP
jgi:quinol-cytochrome oxidoreductase complex cytochrome b subunit/cytochrome c553